MTKEIDCPTNTTEAEPSGGGGGTLDFWKDWPPLPDNFIVPGGLYTIAGARAFLIFYKSVKEDCAFIHSEHFCDEVLLAEDKKHIFFALTGIQYICTYESRERYSVFRALYEDEFIYIVVDAVFNQHPSCRDTIIALRQEINSSITPLDEP